MEHSKATYQLYIVVKNISINPLLRSFPRNAELEFRFGDFPGIKLESGISQINVIHISRAKRCRFYCDLPSLQAQVIEKSLILAFLDLDRDKQIYAAGKVALTSVSRLLIAGTKKYTGQSTTDLFISSGEKIGKMEVGIKLTQSQLASNSKLNHIDRLNLAPEPKPDISDKASPAVATVGCQTISEAATQTGHELEHPSVSTPSDFQNHPSRINQKVIAKQESRSEAVVLRKLLTLIYTKCPERNSPLLHALADEFQLALYLNSPAGIDAQHKFNEAQMARHQRLASLPQHLIPKPYESRRPIRRQPYHSYPYWFKMPDRLLRQIIEKRQQQMIPLRLQRQRVGSIPDQKPSTNRGIQVKVTNRRQDRKIKPITELTSTPIVDSPKTNRSHVLDTKKLVRLLSPPVRRASLREPNVIEDLSPARTPEETTIAPSPESARDQLTMQEPPYHDEELARELSKIEEHSDTEPDSEDDAEKYASEFEEDLAESESDQSGLVIRSQEETTQSETNPNEVEEEVSVQDTETPFVDIDLGQTQSSSARSLEMELQSKSTESIAEHISEVQTVRTGKRKSISRGTITMPVPPIMSQATAQNDLKLMDQDVDIEEKISKYLGQSSVATRSDPKQSGPAKDVSVHTDSVSSFFPTDLDSIADSD